MFSHSSLLVSAHANNTCGCGAHAFSLALPRGQPRSSNSGLLDVVLTLLTGQAGCSPINHTRHENDKPFSDRPTRVSRVRARARRKDRKTNLTSCWMDRSTMKLASRDCAIAGAYATVKLTGLLSALQPNPLQVLSIWSVMIVECPGDIRCPQHACIAILTAFLVRVQVKGNIGTEPTLSRKISLSLPSHSRRTVIFANYPVQG